MNTNPGFLIRCPSCLVEVKVQPPDKTMPIVDMNHMVLNEKEIKALYRIIENEWISRDDDEAMAVADKIGKFVRDLQKGELKNANRKNQIET